MGGIGKEQKSFACLDHSYELIEAGCTERFLTSDVIYFCSSLGVSSLVTYENPSLFYGFILFLMGGRSLVSPEAGYCVECTTLLLLMDVALVANGNNVTCNT